MKIYLVLFLNLIFTSLFSQIGIKISYVSSDFSNIESYLNIENKAHIFDKGFGTEIYYFHNVNGKGIVLMPEIGYNQSKTDMDIREISLRRISIGVPVKFYPFNLEGDCGCPDFSLRNKFFEKHFFILFNDILYWNSKKLSIDNNVIKNNYLSMKIGLGAGITVPFSENIGLEPIITYNWGFLDRWDKEFLYVKPNVDKIINFTDIEFAVGIKYKWE